MKTMLWPLCLGQLVSLLIAATGFTSSSLARRGIDAPTTQSFGNYVLLAVVYGSLYCYRAKHRQEQQQRQVPWFYFFILAIIDVQANYIVVRSYQYTSLTSVMLLDCWTIPCVLVLTWLLLKTRYTQLQLLGAGICVTGLGLVILSDAHASDRAAGPAPVLGDALVLIGAMLYAVSNVSEEFLVKKVDFVELMAFLGSFGALLSAIQLLVLERQELQSIHWSVTTILPFLGYAVAMFLLYTLTPALLRLSGSTMFNLSILTSDMWAVLVRIFLYHQQVDWLYYVSFVTVVFGLVIYSIGGNAEKAEYHALERESHMEEPATSP